MSLPITELTEELLILARNLHFAFERRVTKTVLIEGFKAEYEVIEVDWEQVAKTILERERPLRAEEEQK
jgi:hypothetical protein